MTDKPTRAELVAKARGNLETMIDPDCNDLTKVAHLRIACLRLADAIEAEPGREAVNRPLLDQNDRSLISQLETMMRTAESRPFTMREGGAISLDLDKDARELIGKLIAIARAVDAGTPTTPPRYDDAKVEALLEVVDTADEHSRDVIGERGWMKISVLDWNRALDLADDLRKGGAK